MGEQLKIAGWSPYHASGGVTGHLMAICQMAAEYFGINVDMRADHFGTHPIEGYVWELQKRSPFTGMRDFYSGPDYPDYCRCVEQYEAAYRLHRRVEVYELAKHLKLLRPVDCPSESAFRGGYGEVCFVDSSGRNSPYSFSVLAEADLILAFLPGSGYALRHFKHLYSSYLHKSILILNRISGFNNDILKTLTECDIPLARVAAIPYAPGLAHACLSRNVDTLILDELGRSTHTEYFMRIKEITKHALIEARRLQANRGGDGANWDVRTLLR